MNTTDSHDKNVMDFLHYLNKASDNKQRVIT
jgi:hypothetical protein